jgi:hypothetical protein
MEMIMVFAKRKSESSEQPQALTLEEEITEVKSTISRLEKLKSELAAEEGALWKSGAQRLESETQNTTKRAAEMLLDGAADVVMRPTDQTRMLALGERLAAVRLAIEIAGKRYVKLISARQDEVEASFLPIWREHLLKNVALISALHELAVERHTMIEDLANKTGFRPMPIGVGDLSAFLGTTSWEDPTRIHPESYAGRIIAAANQEF